MTSETPVRKTDPVRGKNGKDHLYDYVVTVTQDHFVTVRARNDRQAGQRALAEIRDRWGAGRNPQVTEIERTD